MESFSYFLVRSCSGHCKWSRAECYCHETRKQLLLLSIRYRHEKYLWRLFFPPPHGTPRGYSASESEEKMRPIDQVVTHEGKEETCHGFLSDQLPQSLSTWNCVILSFSFFFRALHHKKAPLQSIHCRWWSRPLIQVKVTYVHSHSHSRPVDGGPFFASRFLPVDHVLQPVKSQNRGCLSIIHLEQRFRRINELTFLSSCSNIVLIFKAIFLTSSTSFSIRCLIAERQKDSSQSVEWELGESRLLELGRPNLSSPRPWLQAGILHW